MTSVAGMLRGRSAEQARIDGLLAGAVAESSSGCLVVRGDPGIGKTALLDYADAVAEGVRILRCTAVESEAELPFAGLHLLLRPVMGYAGRLPPRQGAALRGAFGLGAGHRGAAPDEVAGDPLLVGLAVLTLLSEVAEERPLLCLVDDAHWLDQASAQALGFAARRLEGEGVVMLIAARDTFAADGLPCLRLEGLDRPSAVQLLADRGAPAGEQLIAESAGNPLALIELSARPAVETPFQVGPVPLTGRVQEAFHQQVRVLPGATQQTLLLVAADTTGRLEVIMKAGPELGVTVADLQPALDARLVMADGGGVAFRHPLIRSATYHGAPLHARLAAHAALATALDGDGDADRRAWHRATAVAGPDEQVAAELERTAARAAARIGHVAAAAAYERSAQLSAEAGARSRRLTLAAEAALAAGQLERAVRLAALTREGTRDPLLLARLDQIRAAGALAAGELRTAYDILLDGAASIGGSDRERAFWMAMEALYCAWFLPLDTGLMSGGLDRLAELGQAAGEPYLSLVWLMRWDTAPLLGRSTRGYPPLAEIMAPAREAGAREGLRGLVLVAGCALMIGHEQAARELAASMVERSRRKGAITWLVPGLTILAEAELLAGRTREAGEHLAEARRVVRDTGQRQWDNHIGGALAYLAAIRGEADRCRAHAAEALTGASSAAGSVGIMWAQWALALLDLGQGRVEAALLRLREMAGGTRSHLLPGMRCLPDLVEAAVRGGHRELVGPPLARFSEYAERMGRPSLDALLHRCLALAQDDEAHYEAALRLDNGVFEQARTRLLYGEWLRRARRKAEARLQLQAGLESFEWLGAVPWAARARAELEAGGAQPSGPPAPGEPLDGLTPQELQIVRLAARGLSNRDIAAQLFLSPKTVAYHLYKAYPKLGISSRNELRER
ncbi:LuxR family transcriptional regulator [Nonomuraea soli]